MTRTTGRFGLFAVVLALALMAFAGTASAVTLTPTGSPLPGSNFQGGDGNQDDPGADVSNPPDGVTDIDWQSVGSSAITSNDFNALDSMFIGGNKESAPGDWAFTTEADGVNPNKDNLLAAWSYSAPSVSGVPNTYLNLAFTREAQTGNTFITFELNQSPDTWNNGQADIACRQTGDLLISYEVASGGTPPNVDIIVYRWITDTGDVVNGETCARTGHFETLDPQPFAEAGINADTITNYLTADSVATSFAPGEFGEASLNLTGILTNANLNPCESFGQISMHTRSSTSIDSQLQDYISPVPLIVRSCGVQITKTGESPKHDNDPETFTYDVTNTGTQPVTIDKTTGVTDDKCSPVVYDGGDTNNDGLLDTSETWTFHCDYTVDHADENAQHEIVNTATVTGTVGSQTVSDTDSYTTLVIHPAIDVTKSVAETVTAPGDTLHYTVTIENTGDTALDVTPADAGCDGFDDTEVPSLAPGDKITLTCTKVVPAGVTSVDNTASADGTDVLGKTVSDSATVSTPVEDARLAIVKTGPDHAYDGDKITFDIAVSNPGTTPVSDVALTDKIKGTTHGCDSLSGPTGDSNGDGNLDPNETWKYTCTYTVQHADEDSSHHIDNVATVQGKSPSGATVGPASDDASVLIVHPAIAIDKTGPISAEPGDKVAYTLTITNPGDESFAASTVQVTDAQCNGDPVTLIGKGGDATPDSFDPGDVWTYSCSVQTATTDVTIHNVASVVGTDKFGKQVGASDSADTLLVLGERITSKPKGAARLLGPTGCVGRAFNARIRGTNVASVVFFLDGKKVKTLRKPDKKGLFQLRVDPRRLKLGVHRLVANVTFKAATGTKPKTLRLSFQRCGRKLVSPRFTG
jgi:uncharacterized repeat protein (TIGR01451 family)